MRKFAVIAVAWLLAGPIGVEAAAVHVVDYATLTGTELINFDDVVGGPAPGTNYDAIFVAGGASFGERFSGQTNTPSGGFDVLSGAPSAPLELAAGPAGQNLNIYTYMSITTALTGLGPLGFPDYGAIGEGSFAVLFTTEQSEFGFQLIGGAEGSATVDFFRRDGSLIDRYLIAGLGESYYGFRRDQGLKDIAGISIFNDDPSGIAFDNLRHDVASGGAGPEGPGADPGSGVPEPGTLVLLGISLAAFATPRRRRP